MRNTQGRRLEADCSIGKRREQMLEPKQMSRNELSQLIYKIPIRKVLGQDIRDNTDLNKMSQKIQLMLRGKRPITMFVIES